MVETAITIQNCSETAISKNNSFETDYIRLRQKEGRIYSDAELLSLPDISTHHIHYKEWQIRKKSGNRLKAYLTKKLKPLRILEVGCGNGWLSNQLAKIPLAEVTGTDVNKTELMQAKRVFSHAFNLEFIYGGINARELENQGFDCVVFASSIQYFPSLKEVVLKLMARLDKQGELHILDSPFYSQNEIPGAVERTRTHFVRMEFPEMTNNYFHHSLQDLDSLDYEILYKTDRFSSFFGRNKNPFPWICIKRQ